MPLIDALVCSHDDESNHESSTSTSSSESANALENVHKRQRQTAKARTQGLVKRLRQQRAMMTQDEGQKGEGWASRLQKQYFTPQFYSVIHTLKDDDFGKGQYYKLSIERSRAVMSLLMQILAVIKRMLMPPQNSSVQHILETVVLDDSSCHLRGPDSTVSIYTVMNTVQALHVTYSDGTSCNNFCVPTHFVPLQSQKTEDLHTGYTWSILLSSQHNGNLFQRIEEMSSDDPTLEGLLQSSPGTWKCQAMIGDSQ